MICRLNSEHFEQKDDPQFCFSKITDSEKVLREMSKNTFTPKSLVLNSSVIYNL